MAKNKESASEVKKTKSPISRKEFNEHAKPVELIIDGQRLTLNPKDFSTGSFGWRNNDKVTIKVMGVPVTVQIGCNLMVVGSKEMSE